MLAQLVQAWVLAVVELVLEEAARARAAEPAQARAAAELGQVAEAPAVVAQVLA